MKLQLGLLSGMIYLLGAGICFADGTTPGPEQWHDGDLINCWSVKANDGDTAPAGMTGFNLFYINSPREQLLFAMGDAFRDAKLGPSATPDVPFFSEEFQAIELWHYNGGGRNYPASVINVISDNQSETIVNLGGSIPGATFEAQITVLKGEEKDFHSSISVKAPVQWDGFCSVSSNFLSHVDQ